MTSLFTTHYKLPTCSLTNPPPQQARAGKRRGQVIIYNANGAPIAQPRQGRRRLSLLTRPLKFGYVSNLFLLCDPFCGWNPSPIIARESYYACFRARRPRGSRFRNVPPPRSRYLDRGDLRCAALCKDDRPAHAATGRESSRKLLADVFQEAR